MTYLCEIYVDAVPMSGDVGTVCLSLTLPPTPRPSAGHRNSHRPYGVRFADGRCGVLLQGAPPSTKTLSPAALLRADERNCAAPTGYASPA